MRRRTHISLSFFRRGVLAAVGIAAISFYASPAKADPSAADVLFNSAKELMKEGHIAEACPKFEASYNEDPLLGALLNAADCREKQGKLAAAWAKFGEAVEKAKKTGDNRVDFAQGRRDALTPRLPMLTITVTNPVPGLTVYRGEQAVDPGAFGVPLPVDPGETTLEVTQGDDVLWHQTVKLGEREKQESKIDEKLIYDSAPAVKEKRKKQAESGGAATLAPVPFWSTQRIAGLVVGLTGVATAIGGFAVGGLALQQKSISDKNCVRSSVGSKFYCTPSGITATNKALDYANASQWTLIAGAAVTAVGVTVFLTAPSTTTSDALEKRAKLEPRLEYVAPILGKDAFGAALGGTF